MTSKAEELVSSSLRTSLASRQVGDSIEGAADYSEFLGALEFFVPEILSQLYPYWTWDSLDDVRPVRAEKTAERQVEVFGMCLLITDQSWTPIDLRLRHSETRNEVEWMQCRVGSKGPGRGGLLRIPFDKLCSKQSYRVADDPEEIDWVFTATLGDGDGR